MNATDRYNGQTDRQTDVSGCPLWSFTHKLDAGKVELHFVILLA